MNGKCEAHFLTKKNPRKFNWTVFYRRLHKKGTAEEVAKKRTRKTTKFQRAIVGASWDQIVAKREQPSAIRKAARDAAAEAAKTAKKTEEAKKKSEKIKVWCGCIMFTNAAVVGCLCRSARCPEQEQGCPAQVQHEAHRHQPLNSFNKYTIQL